MKTYRAIKEYTVEMVDGDGFLAFEGIDEEGSQQQIEARVPIGSLWELDEESKHRVCGGEFHLESIVGSPEIGWIEPCKEDLDEYFEELVEDEKI